MVGAQQQTIIRRVEVRMACSQNGRLSAHEQCNGMHPGVSSELRPLHAGDAGYSIAACVGLMAR